VVSVISRRNAMPSADSSGGAVRRRPTAHAALWNEAFALLEHPTPIYEGTFLHPDFHLGNVLWSHGRITGVVDWVETSWGPPALDVAHAATYLAMLRTPQVWVRRRSAASVSTWTRPSRRASRWFTRGPAVRGTAGSRT
jgi:aminoglycoside phosphotransferase (APT) family kinase protein